MEKIREVALAYYHYLPEDLQKLASAKFKEIDSNGSGTISIREFKKSMGGYFSNVSVIMERCFKELDLLEDRKLDFDEYITLYYLVENGIYCVGGDGCMAALFLKELYFTCVDCFHQNKNETFDLCTSCYSNRDYVHEHTCFVDNHTLLRSEAACLQSTSENTLSEWIFIVISLCLEGLSLAFDQIASPRKPYYGLIGMLLAIVALLVTIWEFVRKGRKEIIVESRRRGMLRWFDYPHSHSSIYGTLPDIYGIFGGIVQFVCSAVQYAYLRRYAESPIQASLLPAIFVLCLGTVKLTESRNGTSDDARPHICEICRQTRKVA